MTLFDPDGFNGKEAYLLRRITRQRLGEALALRERQAAALVTALVERIEEKPFRTTPASALWSRIEYQLSQHPSQATIDSLVGADPALRETVKAADARVARQQLARIERAQRPHETSRRFADARLPQGMLVTA
jgi:hypothetical protein